MSEQDKEKEKKSISNAMKAMYNGNSLFQSKTVLKPLAGVKKQRLPVVSVSAVDYLTHGFNFIVTLNQYLFGFKSVSGLSLEREVDYISEGGVNDHQLLVGAPQGSSGCRLEFERGLMMRNSSATINTVKALAIGKISNPLDRKAALIALSDLTPQQTLEKGPAVGLIQVYNRENKLRAMYSFLSLGMTSWSIGSLDADSAGIIIESISIAHTGLTRVPLGALTVPVPAPDSKSDLKTSELVETLKKIKETNDARKKAAEEKAEQSKKFWAEFNDKMDKLKQEKEEQRKALQEEQEKNKKLLKELLDKENAEKEKESKQQAEENRKAAQERASAADEANKSFSEQGEAARKQQAEENRKAAQERASAADEANKSFSEQGEAARKQQAEENRKAAQERASAANKANESFSKKRDSNKK